MTSVFGLADLGRLPAFVQHYRSLGIEEVRLGLHRTRQLTAEELALFEEYRSLFALEVADPWSLALQQIALEELRVSAGSDWALVVDADELAVLPAPLEQVIAWANANSHNCIYGYLVDHLPAGGGAGEAQSPRSIPPTATLVTWLALNAPPRKAALVRRNTLLSIGQHSAFTSQVGPVSLQLRHMKFVGYDQTYRSRLLERFASQSDEASVSYSRELRASQVLAEKLLGGSPREVISALGLPSWQAPSLSYDELPGFIEISAFMREWRPKHGPPDLALLAQILSGPLVLGYPWFDQAGCP